MWAVWKLLLILAICSESFAFRKLCVPDNLGRLLLDCSESNFNFWRTNNWTLVFKGFATVICFCVIHILYLCRLCIVIRLFLSYILFYFYCVFRINLNMECQREHFGTSCFFTLVVAQQQRMLSKKHMVSMPFLRNHAKTGSRNFILENYHLKISNVPAGQ